MLSTHLAMGLGCLVSLTMLMGVAIVCINIIFTFHSGSLYHKKRPMGGSSWDINLHHGNQTLVGWVTHGTSTTGVQPNFEWLYQQSTDVSFSVDHSYEGTCLYSLFSKGLCVQHFIIIFPFWKIILVLNLTVDEILRSHILLQTILGSSISQMFPCNKQ